MNTEFKLFNKLKVAPVKDIKKYGNWLVQVQIQNADALNSHCIEYDAVYLSLK